MINQQFWQRLPFDLRQQLRVNWEQIVDMQRQAASQAQEQARRELLANGVRLIAPAPEALAHWRAVAREHESVLVEQMGIEPTLLRQAEQVLAAE
jgi:TRAP-type C4-dicarboxylate transport system substrate-binding protein